MDMKLGDQIIPNNTLKDLVGETKKLYDTYKRNDFNKTDIAYSLGQSINSGALMQKIADMKVYGLLSGRGERFVVTPLGEKATYGDPTEKTQAILTLLKNVPLWSILYDKYPHDIKEEGFTGLLSKLTNAPHPDSEKNSVKLRNHYIGDVKYLESVEALATTARPDESAKRAETEPGKSNNGTDPTEAAHGRNQKIMAEPAQAAATGFVAYLGFPEYIEKPLVIKDKMSLSIAKELMKAIEDRIIKPTQESDSDSNDAGSTG